jgi:hypothetical protein
MGALDRKRVISNPHTGAVLEPTARGAMPVEPNTLKSVFGEAIVAQPTPLIQISNQYALDPSLRTDLETFSATGGTADSDNNLFRCQSGTSVGGYGVIRSDEVAVYRAGQGVESRFTAAFTTGVALSLQFGGLFSLTETAAFGYDGADFSIIHEYDGEAEVQHVTVTATPSGSETATVTIDGDAVSCNLTNSTVQQNAFEIWRDCSADATVSGKWRMEQIDDTCVFIAQSVGDKTGTFSFSSSTATANVIEDTAGVLKSNGNIAQASWNITSTPFTGYDPTKLNLYRIEYGYLGGVGMLFSIYDPSTGLFVDVHRIQWANTHDTPIFGNPDMKIGWTAASLGSSGTNLKVTGASAYVAVAGIQRFVNQSFAQDSTINSVGTTLTNLVTIQNRITYGNRFNLGKILLLDVSVGNDHNKGAIIEIRKNATLGGVPNYQFEDETNSIATHDESATTVTGGTLVDAFTVSAASDAVVDLSRFFIELLPEDILTVAGKTVSGTSTSMTATIVWLEEK